MTGLPHGACGSKGIDRHRHLEAVSHRIESFRVDHPDLLSLPAPRELQDERAVRIFVEDMNVAIATSLIAMKVEDATGIADSTNVRLGFDREA